MPQTPAHHAIPNLDTRPHVCMHRLHFRDGTCHTRLFCYHKIFHVSSCLFEQGQSESDHPCTTRLYGFFIILLVSASCSASSLISLSAELHIQIFFRYFRLTLLRLINVEIEECACTAYTNLGQLSIVLFRLLISTSGSGSGLGFRAAQLPASLPPCAVVPHRSRTPANRTRRSWKAYTHSHCSLPGRSLERKYCRPFGLDRKELLT